MKKKSLSYGHSVYFRVCGIVALVCLCVAFSGVRSHQQASVPSLEQRPLPDDATLAALSACARHLQRVRASSLDGVSTLIVYHLGPLRTDEREHDAIYHNNLAVFLAALDEDSFPGGVVFNVVGGESHPLRSLLPAPRPSYPSCFIPWAPSDTNAGDVYTSLLTVKLIGPTASLFNAFLFLNQGVRGPFYHDTTLIPASYSWLTTFHARLFPKATDDGMTPPRVGIVGPQMSCQLALHVQTHCFMLNAAVLPLVLEYLEATPRHVASHWKQVVRYTEVGLSEHILGAGWHLASFPAAIDSAGCVTRENPVLLCDLSPPDLVFIKFGGEVMRRHLLCPAIISDVTSRTRVAAARHRIRLYPKGRDADSGMAADVALNLVQGT